MGRTSTSCEVLRSVSPGRRVPLQTRMYATLPTNGSMDTRHTRALSGASGAGSRVWPSTPVSGPRSRALRSPVTIRCSSASSPTPVIALTGSTG